MTDCHGMNKGDVYMCPDCGLEVQVVSECIQSPSDDCRCTSDSDACALTCCGRELIKKQ